jgi:hypothetical protein
MSNSLELDIIVVVIVVVNAIAALDNAVEWVSEDAVVAANACAGSELADGVDAVLTVLDEARGAGADAALDTTVVGVLDLNIVVVIIIVIVVVEAAASLDNTGNWVAKDAVVAGDS